VGSGGAGASPANVPGERRGHLDRSPEQVASLSQGNTETHNHAHTHITPRDNLERPINLTVMFLDCGRKPEYLEKTHHAQGEHGDSMQKDRGRESNPEPSCCKALPTAPLCSPVWITFYPLINKIIL